VYHKPIQKQAAKQAESHFFLCAQSIATQLLPFRSQLCKATLNTKKKKEGRKPQKQDIGCSLSRINSFACPLSSVCCVKEGSNDIPTRFHFLALLSTSSLASKRYQSSRHRNVRPAPSRYALARRDPSQTGGAQSQTRQQHRRRLHQQRQRPATHKNLGLESNPSDPQSQKVKPLHQQQRRRGRRNPRDGQGNVEVQKTQARQQEWQVDRRRREWNQFARDAFASPSATTWAA